MNAVMERWVQSLHREFLDRCLLWNERYPGMPCARTNTSTTSTEYIKPWPRWLHYAPSRIPPPIQLDWPTAPYADGTGLAESSTNTKYAA